MATETRYFYKDQVCIDRTTVRRDAPFVKSFSESDFALKAKRLDSFSIWVGRTERGGAWHPVTRIIHFKTNGSNHKCDSRCRCAKGGDCECSCGGQFHGIDR